MIFILIFDVIRIIFLTNDGRSKAYYANMLVTLVIILVVATYEL